MSVLSECSLSDPGRAAIAGKTPAVAASALLTTSSSRAQRTAAAVTVESLGRTVIPAIAAAALLCVLPALAKNKKPARAADAPPFEVVLELEQTVFSADEPVTMNATVYNNTDQNTLVDMAQLGARGKYDLLSQTEDALESGSWDPDKDLKPHPVTLKAHGSLSRFVNLNKELGQLLREEGKIRVSVEFCDRGFGGDSAKPRCVESNAVILTVRREPGTVPIHR